jgi:hypothetical protein
LADKNSKSKAKPPPKDAVTSGIQIIKIDKDPSKPPLKEYPELMMEGFRTVITELLKEDRIIIKERRGKMRRIKKADSVIPPNK